MKKLFSLFLLATMALAFTSCKDELNINGKAKESAIVYALLDPAETTHLIKVTRAFVTSDNNAAVAQIADSNYFNSVSGTVTEYVNGVKKRVFNLEDTLIQNKQSGAFFSPNQKMLKFNTPANDPLIANGNTEYRLNLVVNNGEFEVNGTTSLVNNVEILSLSNNLSTLSFAGLFTNANKYKNQTISFDYGNGAMYDLRMKVYFSEFTSATDSTIRSFEWKLQSGDSHTTPQTTVNVAANGETFYKLIAENCSSDPNVVMRHLNEIDITLTSGSDVFYNYMQVSKPQTSLTQNQITYTNLSATNGRNVLGIFTGRTTVVRKKIENHKLGAGQFSAIDKNSMKELCKGTYTGTLFFCSPDSKYQGEDFYCN